MPIIKAYKARTVMIIKRSMNPGFAGIDNELYYMPNTLMLFGDAKAFRIQPGERTVGGGPRGVIRLKNIKQYFTETGEPEAGTPPIAGRLARSSQKASKYAKNWLAPRLASAYHNSVTKTQPRRSR